MGYKALRLFTPLILALSILAIFGGCSSDSTLEDRTLGDSTPTFAELQSQLFVEFARLGIDPSKVAATAPSGTENAVFDLDAYGYEANPGDPPTGIELAWTERVVGDYDQNGEVNIADLSGLGMDFGDTVDYDPAADHGGLSWFPAGDPDDDGGVADGQPPIAASGAANWRLARTDGDGNGELNISDLTPIASHWNQRLSGYRIYRMAPGETSFSLVPNPDDPGLPYTIERAETYADNTTQPDPNRPVRYYFDDLQQAAGDYTYYVAPFDATDSSEGTSSSQVLFAYPGTGPQPPAGVLTPVPASGDVPFNMTWDASGSTDSDGTIAKYEWDMDQDPSTFEWDSGTDPLLPMTYNTPAEHTMTVRVTDNDGQSSVGDATTIATQAGNFPPVAVLSANPPNALTGELVTWEAGASSDQDGTIVKYEWDMDGDPTTFEYDSGTDPTLQVTFTTIGTHAQLVRVTDDGGLTDEVYGTCVVTAGANNPPTAALAPNPPSGSSPLTVTWDASGSSDTDGTIVLYEWDWGNHGTWVDTGAIPTAQTTCNLPGIYDMTVRVTDNLGGTSTASSQCEAIGSWYINIVDTGGDTGNAPSLAYVNGILGIAYYAVTNAPTLEQELRFVLASDTYGTSWGTPIWLLKGARLSNSPSLAWMPTNSYAGISWVDNGNHKTYFQTSVYPFTVWQGPFEIHAEGLWESAVLEVMGKPAAFTYNHANNWSSFEPAVDINGSDWTGTGYYVSGSNVAGGFELSAALVDGNPAVAFWDKLNGQIAFNRSTDVAGTVWPLETFIDGYPGTSTGEGVSLAVINGHPAVSYFDYTNDNLMFRRASDTTGGPTWDSPVAVASLSATPPAYATGLVDTVSGPGVFYADSVSGLMYCQATSAAGSSWDAPVIVDITPGAGYELSALSFTLDNATALYVAYYENSTGDLKFASFH